MIQEELPSQFSSSGGLASPARREQPLASMSGSLATGGAPEPVVAVTGLTKRYALRPVLRGVSFTLAAGKTMVLLGPNGAGKTTLLRILATLTRPTEGQVLVGSADAVRDAGEVRRLIGYAGHQPNVYPELTGLENLMFFARVYGLRDGVARAERLLTRVGLLARARDRVGTYSRGQAQRLALVRALLHEPRLLLLDEPETGLDSAGIQLLGELMAERREAGLSTIFTTHRPGQIPAVSDEAVALARGRIAYVGSASGLDQERLRELSRPDRGQDDGRGIQTETPRDQERRRSGL